MFKMIDLRILQKKDKRIGEVLHTNSGIDVKIIEYNGCQDVTIQWLDDGYIQTGCSYGHLKNGKIRKKTNRLGEAVKQNCGMVATIIEYFNSKNITIQFEDGYVLTKKYYRDFVLGLIKHPDINITSYAKNRPTSEELSNYSKLGQHVLKDKYKNKYLGMSIMNKNGQMMTIVKYRKSSDIDVQFEDGTIVYHQRIDQFKERRIVNPNNKIVIECSINEFAMLFYLRNIGFEHYKARQLQAEGLQKYSLDAYNPQIRVGVEYDGFVHSLRNNSIDDMKDLACKKNNIQLIRIREKMQETNNAICYPLNTSSYFSTEYEDILKQITSFLHNNYNTPLIDIDFHRDKQNILKFYEKECISTYVGKEYVSNHKEHAIVVKYINCNNVVIKFDDGFEKTTSLSCLRKGSFSRYDRTHYLKADPNKRIGQSKIMNNGMKVMCIAYRSCNDCDFQFEDGTIIYNKRYDSFTSQSLGYPKQ